MASVNASENMTQSKACRCGDSDTIIWTEKTSDTTDKQLQKCLNCQVFKSGPLFLSSRGIGWTSWKKRWFILTRTSLIFYRSDPNSLPQKGSEPNLTLGGIDLNSSGSVVIKTDKKLLTVFFPDGQDGRAFTLKAETSEDLHDWKIALENALAQAPSADLGAGHNETFHSDITDPVEASFEQWKDKEPVKSLVVGRPVLLALVEIDGSPSFLEKALGFIEEHGIKVEGILRQSADVEEVKRRVQEYEHGNYEFSPEEDAHVVGDCIKYVLRELPSSPVPASSCTALVEAYRTDRGSRINAMRAAITETFPEPNRHLVQRILKMMRIVASHKSVNRMTLSALAACMAPLLLRPLLAGDCELEDDFNMGGDGSIQLLQAAAAANHAQAIVIILLEEYDKIFDEAFLQEDSLSSDLYSGSEDDDVDDEESTDNDILEDDGYHDADNGLEADIDDDPECSSSGTLSESNDDDGDLYDDKASGGHSIDSSSLIENEVVEVPETPSNTKKNCILQQSSADIKNAVVHRDVVSQGKGYVLDEVSHESQELISDVHTSMLRSAGHTLPSTIAKCTEKLNEPLSNTKRPTVWGRTSARKNLSMESIDYSSDDEIAIQKLETTKSDLQTKITKEIKENGVLQASLEKRKEALRDRRLALEQDVERLQEQLQKEREFRASLEAGLMNLRPGRLSISSSLDNKTRADLEEITRAEAYIINLKQKAGDLRGQLSDQIQHSKTFLCKSCSCHVDSIHQASEKEQKEDTISTTSAQKNEYSSKTKDPTPAVHYKSMKTQTHNSPSSPDKQLPRELHASTINPESLGVSSTGPTSGGNAASKKSSPRDDNERREINTSCAGEPTNSAINENLVPGLANEIARTRAQDLSSSPMKQTPQKLQPNIANKSGTRSRVYGSISTKDQIDFGLVVAVKKTSIRGDTVKKETQDPESSSKGQSLQKQQSNNSNPSNVLSSEETTVGRTGRGEETASTSSTLTRLTNRLNFMKERRVLLTNELQSLETGCNPGPPCPLPRTNSR